MIAQPMVMQQPIIVGAPMMGGYGMSPVGAAVVGMEMGMLGAGIGMGMAYGAADMAYGSDMCFGSDIF